MFRKQSKRHTFLPFVIFRLILSLVMFGFLILGSYSAYKHFSGLDPLKLDPTSLIGSLTDYHEFPQFLDSLLASLKIKGISEGKQKSPGPANRGILSENVDHGEKILTFILVADSHKDNFNLKRALTQAKEKFPDAQFIIGIGDYSEVGTLDELKEAKQVFDNTGLRYFLTVGDHDLWHSRDQSLGAISNFNQVFGPEYQSFEASGVKIIIIHNSDNYLGLGNSQMEWLSRQLSEAQNQNQQILVFLHEPLYHPSSDHVMGKIEPKLKNEARELIQLLAKAQVKKVFAGDTHYFSEYREPETGLAMVTIGAVTAERNPQSPRYAVVEVFEDGSSRVEDVEIK